jgi:hypothetical protein
MERIYRPLVAWLLIVELGIGAIAPLTPVLATECEVVFPDSDSLAAKSKIWDQQDAQIYLGPIPKDYMPNSLPKISTLERLRYTEAVHRSSKSLLLGIDNIRAKMSAGANSSTMLRSALKELETEIVNLEMPSKLSRPGKSVHKKMSEKVDGAMDKSGASGIRIGEFENFLGTYKDYVEKLKLEYGKEFFSDEGVLKAGFDSFAMHLFAEITHTPLVMTEPIYSLALLHPITDDALDMGVNVRQAMGKLSKVLEGKPQTAETPFERVVFDLVGNIQKAYPEKDHPWVHEALRLLHQEQLRSVGLQKAGVSTPDLFDVTYRKGALTSILFGYMGMKKLTGNQREFFYRAGGILQLIDDLLDFPKDLKSGNETVWTQSYRKSKNLDDPLQRFLFLQKNLELASPQLLSEIPGGADFANSFNFGVKMFLGSAMFDKTIARHLEGALGNRFPLSVKNLKKVTYAIFDRLNMTADDRLKLIEILDSGFLSGKYMQGLKKARNPKDIWLAGYSPFWYMVRFMDSLNRWHLRMVKGGTPRAETERMLFLFGILGGILSMEDHTEQGAAIATLGVLSSMFGMGKIGITMLVFGITEIMQDRKKKN